MLNQPVSKPTNENWESEGGSLRPQTEAEVLGVTRFLSETFVVGGYSYTKLRDALAQGRRMQKAGRRSVSVRDTQQPAYFGVLMPLAALALLVWLMI